MLELGTSLTREAKPSNLILPEGICRLWHGKSSVPADAGLHAAGYIFYWKQLSGPDLRWALEMSVTHCWPGTTATRCLTASAQRQTCRAQGRDRCALFLAKARHCKSWVASAVSCLWREAPGSCRVPNSVGIGKAGGKMLPACLTSSVREKIIPSRMLWEVASLCSRKRNGTVSCAGFWCLRSVLFF